MDAQLEEIAADTDKIFDGLPNQELFADMVNDALKAAHYHEKYSTFIITESKGITISDIDASYRIKYKMFSQGIDKGQFECRFNCVNFSDEPKDYILYLESVKKLVDVTPRD